MVLKEIKIQNNGEFYITVNYKKTNTEFKVRSLVTLTNYSCKVYCTKMESQDRVNFRTLYDNMNSKDLKFTCKNSYYVVNGNIISDVNLTITLNDKELFDLFLSSDS